MKNLNAANEVLTHEFAEIQARIDITQECSTLEMEVEHLNTRGKERLWLPQMATQLMGSVIARIGDVIEEREITVYPQGTMSRKQSLNASLKMVACYSALMSGYTDTKTITSALTEWLQEDSISENLDCERLAVELVTNMINADILNSDTGRAITDTGAHYEAHGVTAHINDLRIQTMRNLWKKAQPRMQPMKHAITWRSNGKGNAVCEIPNLMLINGKSTAKLDFIKSANKASQVGYMINNSIRADLELWLESGEMPDLPEDEQAQIGAMNKHEDKVRIVEELLLLPVNETMYFPHTADWRGRFYARGGLTQFQSIKECKAIFDFAESVQVTDPTGLYLHVANAHGMDKVSINKRIEWVKDNRADIIKGDLCNDFYAKRSALALQEYTLTGETSVICHIDGTCNGTQWTAVMFRDAKTGKYVNVCASNLDDNPFDLYGVIADRAIKLATGAERAVIVKHHRELTKSPIMTLGYGAGEKTLIEQMAEFLKEHGEHANAQKVIKAIMTAIKLEAPALTRLTSNLKRILKATPRNTVTWNAFDLIVHAESWNTEALNLYGSSYTAKLVGERSADDDALSRGISPNYIHSMDSAHLRRVIRESSVGLSCIHDSVGCPADMVMETNVLIRKAFWELNQHDLLANIYEALETPYTPQQGSLDIDEVLKATYIFS